MIKTSLAIAAFALCLGVTPAAFAASQSNGQAGGGPNATPNTLVTPTAAVSRSCSHKAIRKGLTGAEKAKFQAKCENDAMVR